MKNDLLCINSDAVNRYNYRIIATALEKSLKDAYRSGMPALIGHDVHRPVGWVLPFGLFIEAGLARTLAIQQVAENDADRKVVVNGLMGYMQSRYQEAYIPVREPFMALVGNYLTQDYQVIQTGCVAIHDAGIAVKLFDSLFAGCNDDGLILLSALLQDFVYLSQGVFKHKTSNLCLFAHRYFRRSQSRFNNFHFFFLDTLIALAPNTEISIKIRLDRDLVGFYPSFHLVGELEFHYGPKYDDDISKLKPGITRHDSLPLQRRFSDVSSTEFYWKVERTENTFELEELKDNPSPAEEGSYHCRYAHAIFNKDTGVFSHFDGAIRSYDLESMLDRVGKTFTQYGRKAHYKKLFRLDGRVETQIWKSLVTHYLQGNPLIYEYFGLAEDIKQFNTIPVKIPALQRSCPFIAVSKEEGLKLLLSYHALPKQVQTGRYIDIFDVLGSDESKMYCLEHGILEVKKVLNRIGQELDIPEEIILTKIEDPYWNIPSIMHTGEDAALLLTKTVESLVLLFSSMLKKGAEKMISLTLSFILNNRVVRISSFGHIANQLEWLSNGLQLELTEDGLTTWVDRQRTYLAKYKANVSPNLIDDLVQFDGVLFIRRVPVQFPYEQSYNDEEGLVHKITFPQDDEVYTLYTENKIKAALHMSIEKAVWLDTMEDYRISPRSKWLDDDLAGVGIVEATPLALYWAPGRKNSCIEG